MSIKKMMYLLSAVNVVALLCVLLAVPAMLASHEYLEELNAQRYRSYLLSDELRQSSDELTRMVRTYSVARDESFKQQYFEVLGIRNGEIARPVDYHRIYWDYVAGGVKQPRPAGEKIALTSLMLKEGFPPEEMALLESSQRQSDDLVNTEVQAMHAMNGEFQDASGGYSIKGKADFKLARTLLHSTKYHSDKVKIMQPLDELSELMELRFERLITAAKVKTTKFNYILALCIAAVLASIAVTIYMVFIRVIAPVKEIVDVVVQVGGGNLNAHCRIENDSELGLLSREVNNMTASLKALTGNMQLASTQLLDSAESMAVATREQEATTAEQAASTQEIVLSSKDISRTGKDLLTSMDEVAGAVDVAANMAQQGNNDLQSMERILNGMVKASKIISQKLTELNEKTSNISMVVTTINKVSDQTNLLSVNAAIEADKAGEAGVGFSTVAYEIRRLADQTAVATWDIEQLVKDIQTAVASGVMGMEKFHEDINNGVVEMQQVSGKFSKIVDQVRIIGPHFEVLHDGMESQARGAEQISEGIGQLSETVQDLLSSIQFSNRAIEEVNSEAKNLKEACAKL